MGSTIAYVLMLATALGMAIGLYFGLRAVKLF
jgi:hypothetical protein